MAARLGVIGEEVPLQATPETAEALETARITAGDLISVGSFSPLTPPKRGQAVAVRYEGLPGTPQASVRFE